MADAPYYRDDLARIHHLGYGFHADACAPGILGLLEPILAREGVVVEVGCGSGLLTRHLLDAGHRVLATDASPAMLAIAREHTPDAEDHRLIALPDDELPTGAAVVSTGHALSYLDTVDRLCAALRACARALEPGGVLALDLEDLSCVAHGERPSVGRVDDDWAIVLDHVSDGPEHLARAMTIFSKNDDGSYRRDFERHDNVLVDVDAVVPPLLAAEGLVDIEVGASFGAETNMDGLRVVTARRPDH